MGTALSSQIRGQISLPFLFEYFRNEEISHSLCVVDNENMSFCAKQLADRTGASHLKHLFSK